MAAVNLPIVGFARQYAIQTDGVWQDGWASRHFRVELQATRPLTGIELRGLIPDSAPDGGRRFTVQLGEAREVFAVIGRGPFTLAFSVNIPEDAVFTYAVDCDRDFNLSVLGKSGDKRDLAYLVEEVVADTDRPDGVGGKSSDLLRNAYGAIRLPGSEPSPVKIDTGAKVGTAEAVSEQPPTDWGAQHLTKSYEDRLREQIEQYRETEQMHDLPGVYHVWSHAFIGPGLNKIFGVNDINLFYVEAFVSAAKQNPNVPVFLSLGCGDGAVEIGIARTLLERGISQFRFICCDLSEILLSRFRAAIPAELSEQIELRVGDLNDRAFDTRFDAVMANHSLHHILDLEGIFRTAYDNLADRGIFVTSDMIGRNGHMRWPEARLFVDFFWPFLSPRQRNNVLLRRSELEFIDHDCSGEGFEGIRSQDVLPLILAQGFKAWKFLGFGGMIDVFVDRCFGPNFDVNSADDTYLIRRMGFLNDILLDAGLVKPTMMLAYFVKYPVEEVYFRNRSVQAAVRDTASDPAWLADALEDFARFRCDPAFTFRSR